MKKKISYDIIIKSNLRGDILRPVKELLREEYWNIAYRFCKNGETLLDGSDGEFYTLPQSKKYWYADPFLFEHNREVYLFVEMFDNTTEKGVIGVSKLVENSFTKPTIVLEENFHLSYPFIFEENGEIYMMPETMGDKCIQLYKAEDFPFKWKKEKLILNTENAVDTVLLDNWLITSVVTDTVHKKTQLELYNKKTGEPHKCNPVCKESQIIRGAGRIFEHNGKLLRPAQNCENGIYGAGLVFYEVQECNAEKYKECEAFRINPQRIKLRNESKPDGMHTYAVCNGLEVFDFKKNRFNLNRLWWILVKKIHTILK